ncbi:MAG: hypothetical protein PSN35_04960 [Candidatus Thioglobus sp.]|uniref:hypothetical protein n=1 Tax=Candidatus Thioglobus sp. TaxID=2026721 RepID=UPI002623E863|nr:hypothetical protein [Candidatus Thioglobus sp.]MDC9727165.1 hypothetical protein [Candidatus Thioglobus sp.]
MNKTLTFAAAITLTTGLIAGGDDRDMGPVEALDSMQPVAEKTVITEQAPDTMTLSDTSKVIGQTPSGFAVTESAHQACQATLGLSDDNIARFKDALAGGFLFNTGPIDAMGTLFSPERWADYFSCVKGE